MCVLDNTAQGLGQGKKQAHFEDSWQGHGASFDPFDRPRAGRLPATTHGTSRTGRAWRKKRGGRSGETRGRE